MVGGSAGLFILPLTGDDLGAGQGRVAGSAKKVKGAVKESGWQIVADPSWSQRTKSTRPEVKVQNAVGALKDVRDAVKK